MSTPTLLHVGSGKQTKLDLKGFEWWSEIRYDIDPDVHPDIIGSITDMSPIADCSVDAVFSSHNIEHVYAHEVQGVLSNFHRVLNEDGFLLITCPDLEKACELVLSQGPLSTVYESPAGPIAAIDMIYGYRPFTATNPYMVHKCGFTAQVMAECLAQAGFAQLYGGRSGYDLWFMAFKTFQPNDRVKQLASKHMP